MVRGQSKGIGKRVQQSKRRGGKRLASQSTGVFSARFAKKYTDAIKFIQSQNSDELDNMVREIQLVKSGGLK
ncbi:hypothetical protein [Parapedobacter koreensis]|uniref:hypothetical protein n=1 Tax=Parapedobacter koreensis TaxID=332977 RepID=UPI000B82523A|nr:hypothetical protein [Parapedobacter koreensis]